MFTSRGLGFRRLAETHAGSVAGDTLIAIALAGTLFFSVPSTEARENVALYLLITLAPFAVIGPFLGGVFERFPGAYRGGLFLSSGVRILVAFAMIFATDSLVLFPLALLALILSRFHGIARSSVLPVVLESSHELVAGNAQLARIGVLSSAVVAPIGLGAVLVGPGLVLVLAAIAFLASTLAVRGLPVLTVLPAEGGRQIREVPGGRQAPPRPVRLARFATAGVRFLNGFLLLMVAFAFRDENAGILDFGAVLAAAGIGYFLAAFFAPLLDRYTSEEPMVMGGLAVEAGAAFVAAQIFSLPAAALLAGAAGFAWGTAKFGFDGLLQATIPTEHRGRAFTNAETFFQFAWVLGALIPIWGSIPPQVGLSIAGLVALGVQVIYLSAVLVPVVAQRRAAQAAAAEPPDERPDLLDLM